MFWVSLGLTGVCAGTYIWLIVSSVPTDRFGWWPRVLLLVTLAVSVLASLAVTQVIPWGSRSWRDWRRPKVLGAFVGLIVGLVGVASSVSNVFAPPAATQDDVQAATTAVQRVDERLQTAGVTEGPSSAIERALPGTWGEPGCTVTYRFALAPGLLTIESVRSVPGQVPLKLELQPEPGRVARLVATTVTPLAERGEQHEFVLDAASSGRFLNWSVRKREVVLRLDRCD